MRNHRLAMTGAVLTALLTCVLGISAAGVSYAATRPAKSYCATVRSAKSLKQLSGVIASLASGPASRTAHLVLQDSVRRLQHARAQAPRRFRPAIARSYRVLRRVDDARALSSRNSRVLRGAFGTLDRQLGATCHLPQLLKLSSPKSGALAPTTSAAASRFQPFGAPVARAAAADPGLCATRNDGRVSIPGNFVVDACWDGSVLHLVNRTSLVQRVSGTGSADSQRTDFPPQEWASWIIAQSTDDVVLPPNYGLTASIGDGAASMSVSPAETSLLETYGLTKLLVGYLPFDPLLENAVAGLIHSIDDAVAHARQCLNGANVFKRVACSAAFTASTTWDIGSFVVDASLSSIKKDAVKGTLRHAAGVLWGLIQEGKYVGDVFGDIIAPGSTRLAIAAAPTTQPQGQAQPQPQPQPQPQSQPQPQPQPTWAEQETPSHPVNTFANYHNASGVGPAIGAGQWVQVACKVYDPTIQSVNPDGYWYRIASSPWNGSYFSPANTFMNGDPVGGPYTHNTDFAVSNC